MTSGAFAPGALLCLAACALMAQAPAVRAQETQVPHRPQNATPTAGVTGHSARITNALDGFSQDVQRLLAEVNPSVVDISTDSFGQPEDVSGGKANVLSRQSREGTGVIVSASGDVITNAHVVMSAKRIQVRLRDPSGGAQRAAGQPRTMPAEIVGIDKDSDLALLRIAGASWKSLRFADSSQLRQGQVVFAVGSPMGLDNSVSMGIISAVDRQLDTDAYQAYIQTDAPINPGNSGGPLINTHGEIVGINTFIFTSSGGNEGLGFAIPSNLARDVYAQLKRYGRVRRGELGVIVRTVTPTLAKALNLPRDRGVLIQDVTPGKAAADAGVQVNDVVIRVEGRSVSNLRQFSSNLFRSEIGGKLKLEVLRGETRAELQVALKERDDDVERFLDQVKGLASPIPQLGILAVPLNRETAVLLTEPRSSSGCIVAAKLQTVSSFQEELEQGDVILGVNGQTANDVDELTSLLKRLPDGMPLVVRVEHQGALRYLVLTGE